MLFEGLILSNKFNYDIEEIKNKYDDYLLFDNGFLGVKLSQNSTSLTNSYFGGVTSKLKETKMMSNLITHNFVSFSLEDFLSRTEPNSLGAGAWYSEEKQRVTLSRDLFGLVPFFYVHVPGKLITFSTSLSALIKNPRINDLLDVNSARISSYSSFLTDSISGYAPETFYKNIKSVPPGHLATLSFDNISIKPFYQFRPSRWSHLSTTAEFGEEFRAKFLDSIRTTVNGNSTITASHLSGGLDSSSVSTAIKFLYPDIILHTLYNISSGADTDENLLALDVAGKIGSTHHEIVQSEDDFGLFRLYIPLFGQPSSTLLSPSFNGSLMQYAKSLGSPSIFNGRGGDSIVGSGLELINHSFERANWQLVKDLLRKRVKYYSLTSQYPEWDKYPWERKYNLVLQNFLFRRLAPQLVQLPFKEFCKLYFEVSAHFDISYGYFLKRGGKSFLDRIQKGQIIPSKSILVDDLSEMARNTEIDVTVDLLENGAPAEHRQSMLDVYSAQDLLAHEQDFVLSNYYQIVNKSPFYSKDLFELCISVPDIIKYGDGIGRAHFREAMKGILPETVRTRSTKAQVRSLGQRIICRLYDQSEDYLFGSTEVWNYVDKVKFIQQVKILQNEKIPYLYKLNTWFHISRTISLAVWLEWLKETKK